MPRIIVLDGQTLNPGDNPWSPLEAHGEVVVHGRSAPEQVVPRSRGADVLIVNKVRLPADVLAQLPDLKLVAVSATGFDCVDVAAARQRNVAVVNVPEYGTDSVAQAVFALLLHLCHRVDLHDAAVQAGEWSRSPDFCFWKTPLVELAGRTMGIVGFGRIGRRVGELARAFGMPVLAHDARPANPPEYDFRWAAIEQLFATADVVSLHCPLTPETAGLVNRQRLALMKPSSILINTSRGSLVVESDLAEALNAGRLAAAAVDVVASEPIRPDNPLLSARNCVITPHIAWATLSARRRLLAAVAENVGSYFAGRPQNVVN